MTCVSVTGVNAMVTQQSVKEIKAAESRAGSVSKTEGSAGNVSKTEGSTGSVSKTELCWQCVKD